MLPAPIITGVITRLIKKNSCQFDKKKVKKDSLSAQVVKLVYTLDLGSSASAWRFKSSPGHHHFITPLNT